MSKKVSRLVSYVKKVRSRKRPLTNFQSYRSLRQRYVTISPNGYYGLNDRIELTKLERLNGGLNVDRDQIPKTIQTRYRQF